MSKAESKYMRIRDFVSSGRGQVIVAFGFKILTAIGGFGVSWLIARLYGAPGVGLYGNLVNSSVLLSTLSLWGQDYVILRSVASDLKVGDIGAARGIVRGSTRLALTNFCVVMVASLCAYSFLSKDARFGGHTTLIFTLLPATLGLILMRTGAWALRAMGSIVESQGIEGPVSTGWVLLALLAFVIAFGSVPVWTLGPIYASSALASAAVAWTLYSRRTKAWPAASSIPAKHLLAIGTPMLISTVSNMATEWAALTSTSLATGNSGAGQLRIALQIMSAVSLVTAAFDSVLGPQIAGAWRIGDHARIKSLYRRATAGIVVLASPLLGCALFAPGLLMGLFGPDFRDAGMVLRVLAIGQLVSVAGGPVGTVLVMSRHDKWMVAYGIAGMVVMAIIAGLAVPHWGAVGGAWVVAGTMIFRRISAGLIVRYVAGVKL
jgi:O-antigen/teichoic acid export membrane protein